MLKCVIAGLILLLFQFTGCGAHCPSSFVNLQAADGEVRILTSPNYPEQYGNYQNCKWRIRAPEQHVVHLHMVDLKIQNCTWCRCHGLSIYDTDNSSRLAILCGDGHNSRRFYSSGRSMDVIFKSDGSATHKGFKLEYSALKADSGGSSSSDGLNDVPLAAGLRSTFALFVFIGVLICICARNRLTTSGRPATRDAATSWTNAGNSGNGVHVVPITQQQQQQQQQQRRPVTGHTSLAFSREPHVYYCLHDLDPDLASA